MRAVGVDHQLASAALAWNDGQEVTSLMPFAVTISYSSCCVCFHAVDQALLPV